MSQGPIATASVKIIPDLTGFATLLRTQVNASIRTIKIQPIKVPVIAAPHRASLRQEVNASVRTLKITPIRVPVIATPISGVGAATAAAGGSGGGAAAAGAGAGAASRAAAKGATVATNEANALRGALIGLSHVTPVTVFGLQAIGVAALASGLAVASAVKSTAEFEKQLNTLQAVTGVSDDQLDEIRKTALALGADTSLAAISAADAAVALTELSKAGLSAEQSLAAVRGTLELAGAAELGAGEAAKFVATELNAFKLAGDQALRVVDLLASASIAAQGEIRDFGNAFQQVGAVAAQANLSVEQTTAALTLLAKAGITSSDAGTSLRTFLLRLIPTTKQASQFVRALGVELDTTKTEGEQLSSIIEQYRAALLKLTPVQRVNVLNQIFGQDAIRAGSVLLTQNVDALQRQIDELDNAGVAAELNAAKARGLSGAWAGLQSNLETAGIKVGSFVDGPLEKLIRGMSNTVSSTDKAAGAIKDFATKVGNTKIPVINIPFKVVLEGDDDFSKFVKGSLLKGVTFGPALLGALFPPDQGVPGTPPDLFPGGQNELNKKFGVGSILDTLTRAQQDEFDRTFGAAARRNKEAQKELRKKIQKLIDEQAGGSIEAPNIVAPRALRNAQLQAQLNDNLQAELKADQAIEDSFRKRLAAAKGRPVLYNSILLALVQAHAATQSVLAQINSENQQAQQARDKAITDAISLQRSRLENAAELTDHTGEAERKLIAFYKAQSKNLQLEASARLSYQAAYNEEIRAQREAIVEQAKADIDLRNARLDLAIQRAGLTPGSADDKRAINNKIKKLQGDIKAIQRIKKLTTEQKLEIIDLQSEILSLQSSLKDVTGQSNGFSLQDLFKAAADQFNTFGSNIAGRNGVLSGQDERAAFSRSVLGNRDASALGGRDKRTTLAGQQLTQQEKTNTLLQLILARTGVPVRAGGIGGAPPLDDRGKKGNLLAIYGTEIAAAYNYGVN